MKRFTNMDKMGKVRFWKYFPARGKETNLMECVEMISSMFLEAEHEGWLEVNAYMPLEECGGEDNARFNRDVLYEWLVKHNYVAECVGKFGLRILTI